MMIHIKTFEGYLDDGELYTKIGWTDYFDLLKRFVKISDRELKSIQSKLDDLGRDLMDTPGVPKNNSLFINDDGIDSYFRTFKSDDDWWGFGNPQLGEYYKCDGLEGLFKLFDDKLSKINESHIEPNVTNDEYWVKINREKFMSMYYGLVEEMSSKNKEKIKSLLKNLTVEFHSGLPAKDGIIFKINYKDYLYIGEIEDDYFIVELAKWDFEEFNMVYWFYKCDQFEGLVQLLKDMKFI